MQILRWLFVAAVGWMSGGSADAGELNDRFGVTQLNPTVASGREWFAAWDAPRVVPAYSIDPADPLLRNGDRELRIGQGIASIDVGQTRLAVLTTKNAKGNYAARLWQNVEMTIYVRPGKIAQTIDYQAIDLSARSGERHNDAAPCDGTSYHATVRFDGQIGFKKEIWHTGGYTKLRPAPAPRPWPTVPPAKWLGMKFVCRNCDGDAHVRLQVYLDLDEQNAWKLAVQFTDAGDWLGAQAGCDRPQNYIIREGRPTVYFRTDQVAVELKKFSVREIAPLP